MKWIQNYLSNRSLQVILSGQASRTFHFNASVAQGSILGPLLFSVFIDDLVDEVDNELLLYADDGTLYSLVDSVHQRSDVISSLNQDLTKIKAWADRWKVIFEPTKCHAMIISRKRTPFHCNLYYDGKSLPVEKEIKVLGVTFDSKLTWNKHLSNVSGRAGQKLGALRRISSKLSVPGRATVYKSQVRSVMEYSSLAWMGAAPTHLKKLDSVQERAIKVIGVSEEAAATSLNIKPLQHRRNVASATLMYKMRTDSCPEKLKELVPPPFVRRRKTRLTSLTEQHAVHQARTRTLSFDRTFIVSGSSQWNTLPSSVIGTIDTENLQPFKTRVNKYLLQ